MSEIPADLRYTKEHEWARLEGDLVTIGITAYAVEQLGDVTLVDLPATGNDVEANARFGDIESIKTVSELFAPISGEVVEINGKLEDAPELVNDSPYDQGWMVRIRPASPEAYASLLDSASYTQLLAELDD